MAATLQGSRESQTVVMLNDAQEHGQVRGAWSVWGWGGVVSSQFFVTLMRFPKIIKLKEKKFIWVHRVKNLGAGTAGQLSG